jgi:biopolymer transport protein ExbD
VTFGGIQMKTKLTIMATMFLVTACTTTRMTHLAFDQAVLASIDRDIPHQPVVVVVDKGGIITVAGRPTTLQELGMIKNVVGLPENPPAAHIHCTPDATHADVRAAMDAIAGGGIWRIAIKVNNQENKTPNKASEVTARPLAEPQR